MRRGELLGLRQGDLELDDGRLRVRHTIQWIANQFDYGSPKTKRGKRYIYLAEDTVEVLEEHLAALEKRRKDAKVRKGDTFDLDRRSEIAERQRIWIGDELDLVFPTRRGTPISPSNLTKYFKDIVGDAKVREIRVHDLRHTWATLALSRGVDVREVSERLGHANVAITMGVYAHVLESIRKVPTLTLSALTELPEEDAAEVN